MLVSIDLDFFCREKLEWDWGHSEDPEGSTLFSITVYYNETDPYIYADCLPSEFCDKLQIKGFVFNSKTKILASSSHKDAYLFFKNMKSKEIYNFDAHHDCGYAKYKLSNIFELDCENWAYNLNKNKNKSIITVYPKWRNINDEEGPCCKTKIIKFSDLELNNKKEVEAVFISQSPAWVPSHFDNYFLDLVNIICKKCKKKINFSYIKRKIIDEKEARKMFNDNSVMIKNLKYKIMKESVLL